MQASKVGRLLVVVSLAIAAPACGEDESSSPNVPGAGAGGEAGADAGALGGGGAGDAYRGDCTPLKVGQPRLYFNVLGELNGVRYAVQTPVGDPTLAEYLLVELFDSTTEAEGGAGFLPPLKAGEFDLSRAPNDHVTSCQHCVSLVTDVTEGVDPFGGPIFQPAGWYFQRGGTLSLSEVHDPLNEALENSALLGGIARVELAELDSSDPLQPFAAGGKCYYVDQEAFDTRPTPGKPCEDLDDCGNEIAEICDPATQRCLDESQCNVDQPCEAEAFCIQQSPISQLGACYPACDPFAKNACPDGQTCVQYGLSEHDGYCLTAGSAEPGEACESKDAATDCTADAVCVAGACAAQCGFFSNAPACAEGTACDVLGRCLSPDAADPAELGESCRASAALADSCARSGERFDGICFGYSESEPLVCGKSCFVDADDYDGNADDGATDPDCAESEFCALRFSSGLGICLPDPVCGDGAFGEVAETCDDGNETSGDGCSADCQTVEYDVLCAAAPELDATGSVDGTTKGGVDGFKNSCGFGTARGRAYQLTVPGPGQLALTLSSSTVQTVGVRSECGDAETELSCGQFAPEVDGTLLVQLTEAGARTLSLIVTGSTVLDEAPFSLVTEFTPQVCGDSLKVGAEACDDGNEASGDGCSADCSAIEYDFWCSEAATLPLDETITSDVEGGPSLFDPSCGYGAGPDRLYQLKAPRAGTLKVMLDQRAGGAEADLALTVLGSCEAPAAEQELGCSAVVSPIEEVSVKVAKGQTVFVVVDGQFGRAGQFGLSASVE